MDWVAAKSYYIGYNSIVRSLSIFFVHNYLFTWSIALICSLILPLLFTFAPTSLHTTRTIHLFIISIICLSYMFCLYIQIYMISDAGEPNLSYHTCRFIVYIATFAKPFGIYLTTLFSIERLFTKIISKFLLRSINYRQLFQRIYTLLIFLSLVCIFTIYLYDVLKLIKRNQSVIQQPSDSDFDPLVDISDTNSNSTDRNITFKYCFKSMNIDTYAKILSFYVVQYWIEWTALGIIILISSVITIHQCYLSRRFSVNTKLYLSLSSCVVASEIILYFLHLIVDDVNNNNTDLQLISLQIMLFAFNLRCIILPFIVCMTTCEPLKQFLYELFIVQPYLENIDENDNTDRINQRPEPFSSSKRTNNHIQQKFRRAFSRNQNNHKDYFDNDELQADL